MSSIWSSSSGQGAPEGSGIPPALWLQGNATYNWPGQGGNEIDFAPLLSTGRETDC